MRRLLLLSGLALAAGFPESFALAQTPPAAAPAAEGAEAPRFRPGLSGGHGRDAFIASHDADGDGRVTLEEALTLRGARFDEADSNGDGRLTQQEYVEEYERRLKADHEAQSVAPGDYFTRAMEQTYERFIVLDRDKNGFMSREEYLASAERAFEAADSDGDGVVSSDDPQRAPGQRGAGPFSAPAEFAGRLRVSAEGGGPILPGSTAVFAGSGLPAGQRLSLMRGLMRLNGEEPLVVDEKGAFSFSYKLPEAAEPGQHQIAVQAGRPTGSTTLDLKISPNVPLSGADLFQTEAKGLVPGLYQAAYGAKAGALFVSASAFGRPGAGGASSKLLKVDPQTLEILAQIDPPKPEKPFGTGPFAEAPMAVFGLGIDEKHGRVWATNTIHNTVAVYDQADLALVKQFEPGLIRHVREILLDEATDRAFASGSASNEVAVFDAAALAPLETIRIVSDVRGESFTGMGLAADHAGGKLYVVSRTTPEIAEIAMATGEVLRLIPVPGAKNAAGLAFDAAQGRLLVASQGSDDLIALNAASGELVFRTPVGAGALGVTVEPKTGRAYVANREAGTITVVGPDGAILANLDGGSFPNHVLAAGDGAVYAVNKARGAEDAKGDRIARISPVE